VLIQEKQTHARTQLALDSLKEYLQQELLALHFDDVIQPQAAACGSLTSSHSHTNKARNGRLISCLGKTKESVSF
jgi:hypothetical protein